MTYRHNPVRPHILDPVITALRRDRLIIAAPFIGVALLALFTPSDDGPTFCPFALCTGTACPGCGMTRAASHLVRGDIGTAITYHLSPVDPADSGPVTRGVGLVHAPQVWPCQPHVSEDVERSLVWDGSSAVGGLGDSDGDGDSARGLKPTTSI